MNYKVGILILSAIMVGSCGRYFAPNRNLKEWVSESKLIGVWELTPKSLKLIEKGGYSPPPGALHTIKLKPDGLLEFRSALDWWDTARYVHQDGKWYLEHNTTGSDNVEKKNALRLELPRFEVNGIVVYLNFDETDGKLILWNYYGDPDSWEFLEYVRIVID